MEGEIMSATTHFAGESTRPAAESMQSVSQVTTVSKTSRWAGRIISGLVVIFLLFDAITKLMKVPQVLEATVRLGFPVGALSVIAVIPLVCTVIYAIPRTAILGAVLLTGYLGGAVATQLRVGSPAFENVFPVLFGVLVWLGVYLRDMRVRALARF
jgi:DoxX-like protein